MLLLVLKLVLHGLFLLLDLLSAEGDGQLNVSRSSLKADACFQILLRVFKEVLVEHEVMLLNVFVECDHGRAGNFLGLLDEGAKVYKLLFVGGRLANFIFHVLVSLVDENDLLTTPGVHSSDQVVLDFSSLLSQLSLEAQGLDSEHLEVNEVVRKVHNVLFSLEEVLNLLADIF